MSGADGADELFHLAERRDWLAAQPAGEYRMSTRGVTLDQQGFIHCSAPHQLRGVADAFFGGAAEVVLLRIDPALADCPVRYEAPVPGGELYPHLYGALPVAAVTEATELRRDPAGRWILPGEPPREP